MSVLYDRVAAEVMVFASRLERSLTILIPSVENAGLKRPEVAKMPLSLVARRAAKRLFNILDRSMISSSASSIDPSWSSSPPPFSSLLSTLCPTLV